MIKAIYDLGMSPLFRAILIYCSLVGSVIFISFLAKKSGLSFVRSLIATTVGYVFMVACAMPNSIAFGAISGADWLRDLLLLPLTMIHGLSFFPVASLFLCKWLKLNRNKLNDVAATGFMLCQGISHFGCIIFGCCYGYESAFGIYNPLTRDYRFPVQIFDGISALIIFAVLLYVLLKKKYNARGILYPAMLISYGVVRAIWELFRDNDKLLGPFSFNTFHCWFMIISGTLYLWLTVRSNRQRKEQKKISPLAINNSKLNSKHSNKHTKKRKKH